ncbi:hypothetical protein N7539_008864 [Penicillium diatomitis]|uniref:Phosphatidic acid phosphatase type 2/haloperoxidase domain-containing protein n=1 Tax=Penicillium diatomitis TaxID=2819901 RepID=A0A9W9WKN4_9EURO|nr:uncharacterized protein N7539_008864 [Penicillium diatomitis]KAJ5469246.1 hypothetical protein N7539_008864 [Penicillium diatomitis]
MGPLSPKSVMAHVSKVLVLSYIIDWVFIIGIALIGYGFYKQDPNHHAFYLTDPSISYPYKEKETVSTAALILASVLGPAVVVFVGAIFVPGTAAVGGQRPSTSQLLLRKLWEWNAGWLGLGLALASAWTATQGLKTLLGRPRPDFLGRCDPDLTQIAKYVVSGLGGKVSGAPTLVDWKICRNQDRTVRVDGFSSFPSGHSSFSFAGLGYLTLWLAAKCSVVFPYLPHFPVEGDDYSNDRASIRNRGAAPPVLSMIIVFFPACVAFFIAASRWFDYRHHGWDIVAGSVIGIFFAWIGIRMYHLPLQRGAGWTWGPRSPRRAFVRGMGFPSSVGTDSWSYTHDNRAGFATNGIHSAEPVHDVENIPMQGEQAFPVERV